MRRVLQSEEEILSAISTFRRGSNDPEWELPTCLRGSPIEDDCVHLLEILDISVTRGKIEIWEEAMEILCRSKTVSEIGMARISVSIKEFSFEKVRPLWVS